MRSAKKDPGIGLELLEEPALRGFIMSGGGQELGSATSNAAAKTFADCSSSRVSSK